MKNLQPGDWIEIALFGSAVVTGAVLLVMRFL